MKLKQQPADFQVEELTAVQPQAQGAFALYRLDKSGWTTPDALTAVRRRWDIDLRRVSCGGLKDRHAQTSQHFTIFHGPRRNLTHAEITVRYLGQTPEPFTSQDIQANRFRLVLRDLAPAAEPALRQHLDEVRRDGVPNYFDDQRFGSAGDGVFVAKLLIQGRFEEGLRLALTAPYAFDRAADKRVKALLRSCWGNWQALQTRLPPGPARELVRYLARQPGDFRGALARLRPELRGLYLSAYQSHLWNRLLARWLEQHCAPADRFEVPLALGRLPMHRQLAPALQTALANLQLPLPSARTKLPASDSRWPLVAAVLAEEGLEMRQLQIKGIREMFFSRGERPALCLPCALSTEFQADDVHPGRRLVILRFELPRGAYATLVVKRITAVR